jgi:hypothetical protein
MRLLERSDLLFKLLLLASVVALFLPVTLVRADAGPKPKMDFRFEYEIDPVSIVEGQLLECEDETCADGKPLEELGPQRFECTESDCSSVAYGYAAYHKLVITFADRVRESNVFTKKAFAANFAVTVLETELRVEETGGVLGGGGLPCCSGLLFTLAVETLVASVYLRLFGLPKAALVWVVLGSVLSLPVVWFGFPQLPLSDSLAVGLSEAFAVLFEAGLIYLAARRSVPFRHAATLSLVMNGASFLFGLVF